MPSPDFQKKLLTYLEKEYGAHDASITSPLPPQGMSSSVFFITLPSVGECVVKYGTDAHKDVPALALLTERQVDIPIPALIASFVFEDVPVMVLKRITFPLLETVPVSEMPLYLPSMVRNLKKLHAITSSQPGVLAGALTDRKEQKTWKEILLSIFDGHTINWSEIASRECLDKALLINSVEKIKESITASAFPLSEYPLLHTDFNQRNIFVDPGRHEIASIIDWEDAMFGDPVYDFARVRMFMWHFNFSDQAVGDYYALMGFTTEEKKREELYWLLRIIQYLAWYSEKLTEFTRSRILLHQEFLRAYHW